MPSEEIKAIGAIEDALAKIKDEEAIQRILKWAADKYKVKIPVGTGGGNGGSKSGDDPPPDDKSKKTALVSGNEIHGIAVYNPDDGTIDFTFRDLKAKNATNAAVRLALLSTYIYEQFTGEECAPRQLILTPLLKDYRINRGSSRLAIINHKGIIADGRTSVKLDSTAKKEAIQIIKEILDKDFKGNWNPNKVGKKKLTKKKVKKKNSD